MCGGQVCCQAMNEGVSNIVGCFKHSSRWTTIQFDAMSPLLVKACDWPLSDPCQFCPCSDGFFSRTFPGSLHQPAMPADGHQQLEIFVHGMPFISIKSTINKAGGTKEVEVSADKDQTVCCAHMSSLP